MSNTLIDKINEEKKICIDVDSFIFDIDNLSKHILDLSLQENIRIHALELYYKQNKDDTIELISRITGMYQFSGTKIIQNFLKYICISEIELSAFLKLECAKSLLSFYEFEEDILKDDDEEMVDIKTDSNTQIKIRNSQRKELGYKALDNVCKYLFEENDFPTPCKIDAICMLMEIDNYKENCNKYFGLVINDNNIECDYRYKAILSLEKKFLHVHGGYLPEYKGSTTFYYSILQEKYVVYSAIFLSEKIDSGPILLRKKFPIPINSEDFDHIEDPKMRAALLIEVLLRFIETGRWEEEQIINIETPYYFIIHPVLKNLAIVACSIN